MCMLAGLSVLLADFFILKAYKQGVQISIGGPIIIGGSIVVVTLMGFFLGRADDASQGPLHPDDRLRGLDSGEPVALNPA